MNAAEAKNAVRQALLKAVDSVVFRNTGWSPSDDTPGDRAADMVVRWAVYWKVDRVAVFTTVLTDTAWREPAHPELQDFLQCCSCWAGEKVEI
jgi:hypothetical protein